MVSAQSGLVALSWYPTPYIRNCLGTASTSSHASAEYVWARQALHVYYSLNSLKGVYIRDEIVTTIGVIKGDTRG